MPTKAKVRKVETDHYQLLGDERQREILALTNEEEYSMAQTGSVWMVFEYTPYDLHTFIELNEQEGRSVSDTHTQTCLRDRSAHGRYEPVKHRSSVVGSV